MSDETNIIKFEDEENISLETIELDEHEQVEDITLVEENKEQLPTKRKRNKSKGKKQKKVVTRAKLNSKEYKETKNLINDLLSTYNTSSMAVYLLYSKIVIFYKLLHNLDVKDNIKDITNEERVTIINKYKELYPSENDLNDLLEDKDFNNKSYNTKIMTLLEYLVIIKNNLTKANTTLQELKNVIKLNTNDSSMYVTEQILTSSIDVGVNNSVVNDIYDYIKNIFVENTSRIDIYLNNLSVGEKINNTEVIDKLKKYFNAESGSIVNENNSDEEINLEEVNLNGEESKTK